MMNEKFQLHIWQNFRIELPADWEMLQFSRNPDTGRCAFADRYQFRCEFLWKKIPAAPDLKKMQSDYKSMLRDQGNWRNIKDRKIAQWIGFSSKRDQEMITRYATYLEPVKALLEVVLIWKKSCDRELEKKILKSIGLDSEPEYEIQSWKAFGLNVKVSKNLQLEECTVLPADVRLKFKDKKDEEEQTFTRKGFVDSWLKNSPEEWFRQRVPERVKLNKECAAQAIEKNLNDHKVYQFSGSILCKGAKGLLRIRKAYNADCWICPKDKRLYSCEFTGDESKNELLTQDLVCCGGADHHA